MQQNYPPKAGIDALLKTAFSYWRRTLLMQLFFSLVYFSVLFLVFIYFSQSLGILEQYQDLVANYAGDFSQYQKEAQKLAASDNYITFFWIMIGVKVFLYPLNLGFFKIYRKLDLKEKIEISDIFAGYSGINFFIYIGYALFWTFTYLFALQTIILAVVWVFLTLFTAPLMFFMNKRIFETISLNIKALKMYFVEILVCILIAFLFKYIGVFSVLGALFTFPFMNAMIYALYKIIFNETEVVSKQVGK